jgi:hypothetical protein
MSTKAILDALATRLNASTLNTTLGGRLGVDQLAANVALPAMVYRVASADTAKLYQSLERYDLRVEFVFFQKAGDGTTMHTLSGQLETALATTLTVSGFDRVTMIRQSVGSPSFEDDAWTMTDTYRAIGFKSV